MSPNVPLNQSVNIFPSSFEYQQGMQNYPINWAGINPANYNRPPNSVQFGNEGKQDKIYKSLNTHTQPLQFDFVKIESEIWDGVVDFIERDRFFVNLIDTNSEHKIPKYQVEFKISELPQENRNQLSVGSIVRWETGLRKGENGENSSFSELSLVNLPPISHSDIKSALDEAEELLNGIKG